MSSIPRLGFGEYQAVKAVNWSSLKFLRKSAKKFKWALENPSEDTISRGKLRAAHTAILEPERFLLDYVLFKGERRAGKAWEEFKEGNDGRTILKHDEYADAIAIAKAVKSERAIANILSRGEAEVSLTWTDEETGIPCKGRIDWVDVERRVFADIKGTSDIDAMVFGSQAAKLGYHLQSAFYRRGLEQVFGFTFDPVLIPYETNAPHDACVFRYPEEDLESADAEIGELLKKLVECRAKNEWPGRYPEEEALLLPAWAAVNRDEVLTAEVVEEAA